MNTVLIKEYKPENYNIDEILRYTNADNSKETLSLVNSCISECENSFCYKVCYIESKVKVLNDEVIFDFARVKSKKLSKNLQGCKKAVVFAATVGIEIDRLIGKYGKISPSKAVVFSAIGAERIEMLCDKFNREIEGNLKPRFSPGYGDLDIEFQREIFKVLEPHRKIGLTLNDSLLMSPSKSVTAIIGISDNVCAHDENNCKNCNLKDCEFRR